MPPAAVILAKTVCPLINMFPPIPHVAGGMVLDGAFTVLICGLPAAILGSMVLCIGPIPHPSSIVLGSFTVFIENMPAARMGDITDMANIIMDGMPEVEIGE